MKNQILSRTRFGIITLAAVFLQTANCLLPTFSYSQNNRLWASYYGGTVADEGYSVATDASGNVYITGSTDSADFPTLNPGGGAYYNGVYNGGTSDAFLVKFDANGNRLWATYYGGSGTDIASSIATDTLGNVYITGSTNSTDFPVMNAGAYFQGALSGGTDAFLVKFDPTGNRIGATYYGGTLDDVGNSITTDVNGDVFVTGVTGSSNFPVLNPGGGAYFQGSLAGSTDAFILRFNFSGVRQWATFYGGGGDDIANSIAADASGNVFVTGVTGSSNFPVLNPGGGAYFQGAPGGANDAFLLKFNNNGVEIHATYYGGSGNEYGNSITTDVNGKVFVAGSTSSANFPVMNPGGGAYFQGAIAGGTDDAFLVKFNNSGIRLHATYYGGSGDDAGNSITTDVCGNVFVTGSTGSVNFPVLNTGGGAYFQGMLGGANDAFLLKFNNNGVELHATYYGGSSMDNGKSVAADASGNVFLSGSTSSSNGIASAGSFQNVYGGAQDAYLVKFTSCGSGGTLSVSCTSTNASCVLNNGSVCMVISGGTSPYTYIWSGSQTILCVTGLPAGTYTAIVTDGVGSTASCTSTIYSDTISQPTVFISGPASICAGQNANLCASGGTVYSWSPGGETTACISVSPTVTATYTVFATNASGCTGSTSFTVIVNNCPCSATFYLFQDAADSLRWHVHPTVKGQAPFSYLWDFGDGNTSTQHSPKHTYAVAGHYNICLSITDANNCTSNYCDSTYRVMGPGIIKFLEVDSTTGIQESPVSINSVFPNPSKDMIEVSFSDFVKGELKIADVTGRDVYSEKINANNVRVNVSALPVGYYTLSVVSETKTMREKIMIAR